MGFLTLGLENVRAGFSRIGHTRPLVPRTSGAGRSWSTRVVARSVRITRSLGLRGCSGVALAPSTQWVPWLCANQSRDTPRRGSQRPWLWHGVAVACDRKACRTSLPGIDINGRVDRRAARLGQRSRWRIWNCNCQVNNGGARLSTIRAELRNATAGIGSFTMLKKRIPVPFQCQSAIRA